MQCRLDSQTGENGWWSGIPEAICKRPVSRYCGGRSASTWSHAAVSHRQLGLLLDHLPWWKQTAREMSTLHLPPPPARPIPSLMHRRLIQQRNNPSVQAQGQVYRGLKQLLLMFQKLPEFEMIVLEVTLVVLWFWLWLWYSGFNEHKESVHTAQLLDHGRGHEKGVSGSFVTLNHKTSPK